MFYALTKTTTKIIFSAYVTRLYITITLYEDRFSCLSQYKSRTDKHSLLCIIYKHIIFIYFLFKQFVL